MELNGYVLVCIDSAGFIWNYIDFYVIRIHTEQIQKSLNAGRKTHKQGIEGNNTTNERLKPWVLSPSQVSL